MHQRNVLADVLFTLITLFVASCSQGSVAQQQTLRNNSAATISVDESVSKTIRIKSSNVYCWWWSEALVLSPSFDADTPPPKDAYVELEEWRYDGERLSTAPHEVDFVSEIINDSTHRFEGKMTFKVSSRYEEITYISDSDIPTANVASCEDSPWMHESVILERRLMLESGKLIKLERHLDLTDRLNKKNGKKGLCSLKFVVEITAGSDKNFISEKTISVALGD